MKNMKLPFFRPGQRQRWRHAPQSAAARRHKLNITFTGDEGKPWRAALGILCALVFLLLLILGGRSQTDPMNSAEVLTIQDRGVLRVGVRTDMPGMGENGQGLEIELAARMAQRLLPDVPAGNNLKLVEVNAMDVGAKFSDGAIDMAIALMPRGTSNKYAYSHTYYTDPCYFIAAVNTPRLAIENISIGCVQNTPPATLLSNYAIAHPEANLTQVKYASYPDMLTALMHGRVDLAVMSELYIHKYQNEKLVNPQTLLSFNLYEFRASGVSIGNVEYAVACLADTPAIALLADDTLAQMREDGSLGALYNRYGLVQDYGHEQED